MDMNPVGVGSFCRIHEQALFSMSILERFARVASALA